MTLDRPLSLSDYLNNPELVPNRLEELIEVPGKLAILVTSDHAMILSFMAEVALLRNKLGKASTFIDISGALQYSSSQGKINIPYSWLNRVSRNFRQSPFQRLKRILNTSINAHINYDDVDNFIKDSFVGNKDISDEGLAHWAKTTEEAMKSEFGTVNESDPLCDPRYEIFRREATSIWRDCYRLSFQTLKSGTYSCTLTWADRFVAENAAGCASLMLKIPCYVMNEGASPSTFLVSRNSFVGMEMEWAAIRSWRASVEEVRETSRRYLHSRIERGARGEADSLNPFSAEFASADFESATKLGTQVALFLSSWDELYYQPRNPAFHEEPPPTQNEVIDSLTRWAECRPDIRLVIRCHPHFKYKRTWPYEKLLEIERKKIHNVRIIWPHDPSNSYQLVAESDVIVSCGSTISQEAAYMGKPVVNIAPFNSLFDAGARPTTVKKLLRFIDDPLLIRKNMNLGALNYFLWAYFAGTPQTFTSNTKDGAEVLGVIIEPFGTLYRPLRKIARLFLSQKRLPIWYAGRSPALSAHLSSCVDRAERTDNSLNA